MLKDFTKNLRENFISKTTTKKALNVRKSSLRESEGILEIACGDLIQSTSSKEVAIVGFTVLQNGTKALSLTDIENGRSYIAKDVKGLHKFILEGVIDGELKIVKNGDYKNRKNISNFY